MKKTLLAFGLLTTIGAAAQTTVTFEDLTLAPNSHYDGSDLSGQFISAGITFPNTYSGYWAAGWIYSNSTDVTTAGYTNDFSAYTGVGANGSPNYAVAYNGTLDFGGEYVVESFAVTNTTYAALSMLNGDSFGKQFGSVNGANGQPDGTNGEDYFRMLIIGSDANGETVDTITFYLADYRFANNEQDYIVDSWETVNISALGAIRYLDFVLESSDNHPEYGMNTPNYFALDNLKFEDLGVHQLDAPAFAMYPNPTSGNVTLKGDAGTIAVFDAAGTRVYTGTTSGLATISLEGRANGFYVVELTNATGVSRATLVKN